MKSTGIVRRLDPLGRVVVPKELRNMLYLDAKDPVEVFTENDTIILRKYEPQCVLCGQMKDTKNFKGKLICASCIEVIVAEK